METPLQMVVSKFPESAGNSVTLTLCKESHPYVELKVSTPESVPLP